MQSGWPGRIFISTLPLKASIRAIFRLMSCIANWQKVNMEPKAQPLKRCGCNNPTEKCADLARTVKPAKVDPDATLVFDVRREADYAASDETIPGALWKNPEKIDAWIGAVPRTLDVVIYCVRGGAVSNSVVDRLQAAGVKARYIEGGLEAYKAAGGKISRK